MVEFLGRLYLAGAVEWHLDNRVVAGLFFFFIFSSFLYFFIFFFFNFFQSFFHSSSSLSLSSPPLTEELIKRTREILSQLKQDPFSAPNKQFLDSFEKDVVKMMKKKKD